MTAILAHMVSPTTEALPQRLIPSCHKQLAHMRRIAEPHALGDFACRHQPPLLAQHRDGGGLEDASARWQRRHAGTQSRTFLILPASHPASQEGWG